MTEISRRRLLGASGIGAGAGLAAGIGGTYGVMGAAARGGEDSEGFSGKQTVPFYGAHQAGVETPPQAHAVFLAVELKDHVDAAAMRRWLRILSDDAAALTQGKAPLADTEPEMTAQPASLTVTFGFGRKVVELAGADKVPAWLKPLPDYSIDRLRPELCGGDLLMQICSDDPLTLAHASRMLMKDSRAFSEIAWAKESFRRAYGTDPKGTTVRNPFGQVDGTVNPEIDTDDFAALVWGDPNAPSRPGASDRKRVESPRGKAPADLGSAHPDWMAGGTTLVLRDIAMDLESWDLADEPARDFSIGRRMKDGSPLTGEHEHDIPDLEAVGSDGFKKISPASHVARSRNDKKPEEQIFRRVYSYQSLTKGPIRDDVEGVRQINDAGLMFASYQADIERQYKPIQQRLAEGDLLNEWTFPIGSTVWAIPPGASEGGYIGETLFG